MKRAAVALLFGGLLAAGSIGLALLPNAFNQMGDDYNQNLRLTLFLGTALQGGLVAGLWLLALHFLRPSASTGRLLLVVGVTVLLAAAVPCPSILSGSWADGLIGVYAVLAGMGAALCVWAFLRRPGRSAHDTGVEADHEA